MSKVTTIEITKQHENVLRCVPESTRGASANAAYVQRKAQVAYGMTAESVGIHFGQIHEMGLIECASGYCKRTKEGDEVLG